MEAQLWAPDLGWERVGRRRALTPPYLPSLLSACRKGAAAPESAQLQKGGTIFRLLLEEPDPRDGNAPSRLRGAADSKRGAFNPDPQSPLSPPPATLRWREPRRSTGAGRAQGHLANQGRAETPASRPFLGLRRWVGLRPRGAPGQRGTALTPSLSDLLSGHFNQMTWNRTSKAPCVCPSFLRSPQRLAEI